MAGRCPNCDDTLLRIPAWVGLGVWFLTQFPVLPGQQEGVAWAAHVGGFLAGVVLALGLRYRRP